MIRFGDGNAISILITTKINHPYSLGNRQDPNKIVPRLRAMRAQILCFAFKKKMIQNVKNKHDSEYLFASYLLYIFRRDIYNVPERYTSFVIKKN